MTEGTTPPLDEIRGLVAERERFETWLHTLEARRSATPPHVFDRVWQDYEGRRARVDETLAGHVAGLQTVGDGLATRHGDLTRTLGERRDALAEIELRSLVGEFDESHGATLRAEAQSGIDGIEGEARGVEGELSEVRALLVQVHGPQAAPAPDPIVELPVSTGSIGGPDAGPDDRGMRGDDAGSAGDAPRVGGASIDRSVASERGSERDAATMMGDARGGPAFAGQGLASSALGGATVDDRGDARFGASTQKTLKCPECSAMNFPTEWYCERCGGELAAL